MEPNVPNNHEEPRPNLPLVSVIMPVYNAERFVAQAIDSVLSQTYSNIELILVNDCSKDRSLQILRAYEQQDQRVRVLNNEKNVNAAQTRNNGIQAARGAYIALLDSDDVWEKTKLEKQIKLMLEQNADIAYCAMELIDEDNQKINTFEVPPTTNYQEMLVNCYLSCSTVVIEANLLKAHPFRSDYFHEDYLLWTELLALNVKAVGLQEVLAYYRQTASSRSHGKLKSAMNRWKIYRNALDMNLWQCCITFVKYAIGGIKKYYL